MSHLFFIDESGQDRRQMPYEIHGGIAVPLNRAWDLILDVQGAQARLFSSPWKDFEVELKGERLLQRRVFQFAEGINKKNPAALPVTFADDVDRRNHAHSFMEKGYRELLANRDNNPIQLPRVAKEFRAYGLACIELAEEVFMACEKHGVVVLAAVVDPQAPRPPAPEWDEMLRKDLVFLFERLFYLMESHGGDAIAACVFDQLDDFADQKCMEGQRLNDSIGRYFTRSHSGRLRSRRILPEPLYARSDLTTLLGIADLAIYVINHVFRPLPDWTQPIRDELRPFIDWIYRLQWTGPREDGSRLFSIFHLDDLRPRSASVPP